MSRSSYRRRKPAMKDSKSFEFKIPKNNSTSPINDIDEWIAHDVKGKWVKRELKTIIIYTFHSMDDAFNFKLKWALS